MTDDSENVATSVERIAKRMARAGVCSRREAESLIAAGVVKVNGKTITSPALNVSEADVILVRGKPIAAPEKTRLWLYHKPDGLVTTHRDEKGRASVFDALPKTLPRVISVGRLDLTTEGLLLLTNDGALARHLELPSTGWIRHYRARVYGRITEALIEKLARGVTVEGVRYGAIGVSVESQTGSNAWVNVRLAEGKNREIRNVFEHFECRVNRLIRTAYGPFQLGKLARGEVKEVTSSMMKSSLGNWQEARKKK